MSLENRLDSSIMTALNVSEVSQQFKVNRSTIYRAVSSGRLSRCSDGSFDLAEVIRCFGEPAIGKVAVQHSSVAPQQVNPDQTKVIELLQKELEQYRNREERLLDQIDRMQTLIELKSQPVAGATSQQQSQATQRDSSDAISETIENKDIESNATLQATPQQQPNTLQRNTVDATLQQPQKKRGLLGRLVQAVFDDE